MKIKASDIHNPTVIGGSAPVKLKVEENDVTFEMLSSGLYSFPRMAILRELAVNALDAHIEAGKEGVPFIVDLPTRFEHVVRFRDFGEGISHDFAITTYTTYFASTKRDSNNTTGTVGLGCKSPLGYTESFTVNSFQKGKKRTYFISLEEAELGEGKIPHFRYMGEVDGVDEDGNVEPDGLEVIIPCKEHDYYSWADDAREIFKWFDVKPIFAHFDPGVPEITWVDKVGNVRLTSVNAGGNGRWIVQQGPVAYPVELARLGEEYEMFNVVSGIITVPMGEVHFPPNREAVKYNTWTIENLQRHLDTFKQAYTVDLVDAIGKVEGYQQLMAIVDRVESNKLASVEPTVLKALMDKGRKVLNAMFEFDLPLMERRVKMYAKKLDKLNAAGDFEGVKKVKERRARNVPKIAAWLVKMNEFSVTSSILPRTEKPFPYEVTQAILTHVTNTIPGMPIGRDITRLKEYKYQGNMYLKFIPWSEKSGATSVTVYVNDTEKAMKAKVRKLIKYRNTEHTKGDVVLFMEEEHPAIEAFFEKHEIPVEFIKVSTIEFPKVVRGPASKGRKGTVLRRRMGSKWQRYGKVAIHVWDRALDKDDIKNMEDPSKYAWCEIKGFKFQGVALSNFSVDHFVQYSNNYDLKGVIGVGKAYVEEFSNDPRWQHINDFIPAVMQKQVDGLDQNKVLAHLLSQELNSNNTELIEALHPVRKHIVHLETRKLFDEVPAYNYELGRVLARAESHGITTGFEDGHNGADTIDAGLEKLYNSVTCLKLIAQHSNPNSREALEIVNLINTFVK